MVHNMIPRFLWRGDVGDKSEVLNPKDERRPNTEIRIFGVHDLGGFSYFWVGGWSGAYPDWVD